MSSSCTCTCTYGTEHKFYHKWTAIKPKKIKKKRHNRIKHIQMFHPVNPMVRSASVPKEKCTKKSYCAWYTTVTWGQCKASTWRGHPAKCRFWMMHIYIWLKQWTNAVCTFGHIWLWSLRKFIMFPRLQCRLPHQAKGWFVDQIVNSYQCMGMIPNSFMFDSVYW